ncbi:dienelactone hydrolase family protein [Sphingomonas baiyangensis]|uniref:Dienelactone hydrolase family protein n=1 Tax=Sphingomonas baiyangensis TaxID=2572576 RepID=A0A4U1L3A9_9SPHN|nr:dienelactone hydrolase family protein [Sphingomonas baiyangensis]TKD50683.1 dienelactone hydrolase family protein [Sphingomonas baiyangensis]
MSDLRRRAIDLYDAFTHEHRDRRRLLREMGLLAGSVAAAETLIATIAPAAAAAAQQIDPADPRIVTRKGGYAIGGGTMMTGYFAAPRNPGRKVGAVIVVHENRGLNAHIEGVARRVALAGFFAVAPDFLTPQGGTPADPDAARDLIGTLDYDAALAAGQATIARLARLRGGTGKVGAVGFCWGGGYVNRLAVAAGPALAAAAPYYGPAPDPAEAPKVEAAMAIHLAGNDARVNTTGVPWGEALKAAGKRVDVHVYPGAEHAFNNDTSAERYDAATAQLAWDRTMALFERELT